MNPYTTELEKEFHMDSSTLEQTVTLQNLEQLKMDSFTSEFGTIPHRKLHYMNTSLTLHGQLHYMDGYTKWAITLNGQLYYILDSYTTQQAPAA